MRRGTTGPWGFFALDASMTEQQFTKKFRDFHKNFGEEQDWNLY
ncbi:hypothetical protein [Paenibacillus mucilaginosus]|uniref:Uncharacterized protein n=1 Tax=Paenibacillus mucilaginosus (strain KNP414) TaxID=1036673 RepID=F8FGC7_PAEMK|nr:hypothetical protein [Paenibacillus mucilaginosus]AEI44587.1 hypothetical protein KNP414_06063 [Paenibacillus mucilaginosus KNP414]